MQQHTRYSLSFRLRLSTSAAALALLAACGGGDSSSSIGSAGGGATGSGGSTNGGCDYPDKITASERQQANSCGIQVSGLTVPRTHACSKSSKRANWARRQRQTPTMPGRTQS